MRGSPRSLECEAAECLPWLLGLCQACMNSLGKGEAKEIPKVERRSLHTGKNQNRESLTWTSEQAQLRFPLPPLLSALTYASSWWTQQSSRFFIPTGNTTAVGTVTLILFVIIALIQQLDLYPWHFTFLSQNTGTAAPGTSQLPTLLLIFEVHREEGSTFLCSSCTSVFH